MILKKYNTKLVFLVSLRIFHMDYAFQKILLHIFIRVRTAS